MAQERFMINGDPTTKQPDTGLGYSFETTYSEDSVRVRKGKAHTNALFTVESYSYKATNLTAGEMANMLQKIAKGKTFTAHHRSAYYGGWRDDEFYVGKGSLNVGSWKEDEEVYDSLSFNMIGVNPL